MPENAQLQAETSLLDVNFRPHRYEKSLKSIYLHWTDFANDFANLGNFIQF